ncbi:hypothetical protein BT67DRAFT_488314 [Trichocladium antarcticum]|uniref:Uncharacterized protein n=1 Tax=Trichocladium antarcticum TaxID=1450529 RepID=A0AAN6UPS2_9PEZI|nr:hypothetical protein BT67DRAFT_488314 [Trichocladium antarcticum]
MARHNSSAGSVNGPALAAASNSQLGAALTPTSALQLFLKTRQRSSRKFNSSAVLLSTPPKSLAPSRAVRNPSLPSSLAAKADAILLQQHLDRAKTITLGTRGTRYKRYRNPDRALNSFLVRRSLWRSSRRPTTKMDFINHLRLIQADDPSSDEDSSFSFVSDGSLGASSTSDTTALTTPDKSDEETKPSGTKRKRKRAVVTKSAPSAEDAAETLPAPKKAKTESVSAPTPSATMSGKTPAVAPEPARPNGTRKMNKRKLSDEKNEMESEPHAAKKMKPQTRKRAEQVPVKATSSTTASAAPVAPKPLRKMEYFEERVHEMLTNPLGFDDLVYPTDKPVPNYVKRQFAKCRRSQREPTPPLEMSGALGPAPDAKPATTKRQPSESLAMGAQKRAHQQKVKAQGRDLKGKPAAAGRKQGGQQQPTSARKYSNKSAYSDVPTMSGAIPPEFPVDDADEVPTMSGAIASASPATDDGDELPTMSGAITPAAPTMGGALTTHIPGADDTDEVPTMSGALASDFPATNGANEIPTMSGALAAYTSADERELFKLLSDALAAEPSTAYDADEVPAMSGAIGPGTLTMSGAITSANDITTSNKQHDSTINTGIQEPHAVDRGQDEPRSAEPATRPRFWAPKNDGFILGDIPGDVFDTPLSENNQFNWPPPRRARSHTASHVPPGSPTPRRKWQGPMTTFAETHEWKAEGPLWEDGTTTEEEGGGGDETEADVETEVEGDDGEETEGDETDEYIETEIEDDGGEETGGEETDAFIETEFEDDGGEETEGDETDEYIETEFEDDSEEETDGDETDADIETEIGTENDHAGPQTTTTAAPPANTRRPRPYPPVTP